MPLALRLRRRDGQTISHLSDSLVALNEFRNAAELRLIEGPASLALPRRFGRLRQRIFECFQLAREILRALRLHAVLQALIKDEGVAQIDDRVLVGRALDRLELVRLIALLADLAQEGRELSKAEIFSIALFPAEEAEHFRILNDEGRTFVGHGCAEEKVGEPLHCADLFSIGEPHGLFAVNDEK